MTCVVYNSRDVACLCECMSLRNYSPTWSPYWIGWHITDIWPLTYMEQCIQLYLIHRKYTIYVLIWDGMNGKMGTSFWVMLPAEQLTSASQRQSSEMLQPFYPRKHVYAELSLTKRTRGPCCYKCCTACRRGGDLVYLCHTGDRVRPRDGVIMSNRRGGEFSPSTFNLSHTRDWIWETKYFIHMWILETGFY